MESKKHAISKICEHCVTKRGPTTGAKEELQVASLQLVEQWKQEKRTH